MRVMPAIWSRLRPAVTPPISDDNSECSELDTVVAVCDASIPADSPAIAAQLLLRRRSSFADHIRCHVGQDAGEGTHILFVMNAAPYPRELLEREEPIRRKL